MKKIGTFELMWAIYFIAVGIIWMVFEKAMGWHDVHIADHEVYTNFFSIVAILVVVLYMKAKKRQLAEENNYKNLLLGGIGLSVFIALLSPISMFITFEYITPDYISNAINYAVESGNATQEEAEAYFNFSSYIIQSSIFALIIGIITSAIVAIFFRKK
jgi:hypothetical protein